MRRKGKKARGQKGKKESIKEKKGKKGRARSFAFRAFENDGKLKQRPYFHIFTNVLTNDRV
jgi:hypothetical protein